MEEPVEPEVVTPLQGALDGFATALSHLVKVVEDGALCDLGAVGVVEFLRDFETVRNRMPLVDHAVIEHGTDQGVPEALNERSMIRVLTSALRLSPAEASRRVRAAEQLGGRHTMLGEPLPPVRPHLAQAQRDGLLTPEHVTVIHTILRRVDHPCFDAADVSAGEQILVEAAKTLAPVELRELAQKVVDAIDPDGSLPDDEVQRRRRFLSCRRRTDGMWRGEFLLTAAAGAKLDALLSSLGSPRITRCAVVADDEPSQQTEVLEVDERTRGQRLHDALEDVFDRCLRSDDLPEAGGTPATVLVHIDVDQLDQRRGFGRWGDGTLAPSRSVQALSDEAEIIWCLKDAKGAVLDLSRSRRIASRSQTLALIARDGGCSFPGCDINPSWCERHHITSWLDGGPTNLDNLTLLCRYHHQYFEKRGWNCRLGADRLPVWVPPTWIDRQQRPILNERIRVRRWRPQGPLPSARVTYSHAFPAD